jgi:hypothetical protein
MTIPDFRSGQLRLLLVEVQDDGAAALVGKDTRRRAADAAW